jgi:signal transduction histidine kinase
MNKETLDRIFDPFYTTKDVGRGTGLGLSISLGLVQRNGGEIRVYSQPGEGSRFIVALPRAKRNSIP